MAGQSAQPSTRRDRKCRRAPVSGAPLPRSRTSMPQRRPQLEEPSDIPGNERHVTMGSPAARSGYRHFLRFIGTGRPKQRMVDRDIDTQRAPTHLYVWTQGVCQAPRMGALVRSLADRRRSSTRSQPAAATALRSRATDRSSALFPDIRAIEQDLPADPAFPPPAPHILSRDVWERG